MHAANPITTTNRTTNTYLRIAGPYSWDVSWTLLPCDDPSLSVVVEGRYVQHGRQVSMLDRLDELGLRIIGVLGEDGARELLDVCSRSDEDRSTLIRRLTLHSKGEWLAEILIDFEHEAGEIVRLN
jgi:hypothetical protein